MQEFPTKKARRVIKRMIQVSFGLFLCLVIGKKKSLPEKFVCIPKCFKEKKILLHIMLLFTYIPFNNDHRFSSFSFSKINKQTLHTHFVLILNYYTSYKY